MLTVKEFEDLGVEMNDNDKVRCTVLQVGVISFSWRTNTGVKPAFNGVIEVKLRSGRVVIPSVIMYMGGHVAWELDGDQCDIVEWRPLLDQSALKPVNDAALKPSGDKPVFTQSMADAGKLPPVGSKILALIDGVYVKCELLNVRVNASGMTVYAVMLEGFKIILSADIKPIDNRTPKQKAVDGMLLELNLHKHSHYEVLLTKAYEGWFECN